jgi:hypothetical protein
VKWRGLPLLDMKRKQVAYQNAMGSRTTLSLQIPALRTLDLHLQDLAFHEEPPAADYLIFF